MTPVEPYQAKTVIIKVLETKKVGLLPRVTETDIKSLQAIAVACLFPQEFCRSRPIEPLVL